MSEVSDFCDRLYKYSEKYNFDDADAYMSSKIDFMANTDKYEIIDSILYNLDLNKIKAKIAHQLIRAVMHYSEKLIMRTDFISRAQDHFGKDNV